VIISYRKKHNPDTVAYVESGYGVGPNKLGVYRIAPELAGLSHSMISADTISDEGIEKALDAEIVASFTMSAWDMKAVKTLVASNEGLTISLQLDQYERLFVTHSPNQEQTGITLQYDEFDGKDCRIKFDGKLIRVLPTLQYEVKILSNGLCIFETADEDFIIYAFGESTI
jgi:hypothetical protein